jgi:hypothetical protein
MSSAIGLYRVDLKWPSYSDRPCPYHVQRRVRVGVARVYVRARRQQLAQRRVVAVGDGLVNVPPRHTHTHTRRRGRSAVSVLASGDTWAGCPRGDIPREG